MGGSIRCAIDIAPLGGLADPRAVVRLALAAEASGWEGISIWDSLGVSMGTAAVDPFVALAAVAQATERLRLITSVVALPRRRPHLVAQAVGSLDRLSGGRVILGVGLGGDAADFETFGEPFEPHARSSRFDESMVLLDEHLRGTVGSALQRPRPPIWFGGNRPGALRRAARLDGWIADGTSPDGSTMTLEPDELGTMIGRLRREREAAARGNDPIDIALFGFSEMDDPGRVARFAEHGATWWLESLSPMRGNVDELISIVEAGPPG